MSITAAIIFCPLPIAHFTARRWFISSIGRILASGYYRVEFRDFFLADEMNSLSYSIEQFEFAMCAYSEQWSDLATQCSTSHMWITPFLTALPAWFRLLQCLRRYRDTLEWFPHLVNAGKYSASLINLFVYFSFRHYGGAQLKTAWIFVSVLTSCYTFGWDVYMDWGLFRFGKTGGGAYGHPFLRQELVYSRTWVYYMAIVLDFLGRFSWTARLIPMNVNVMVLSFVLAFLEVLRRWQWNFFRLENEHLNNCGQFRAIKDIPLPFHIRVQGESDDEDDEDDDNNNNNNNHSHYSSSNNIISDSLHYHQDRSGSHPDLHRQDIQYHVHQEGVFHLQEDQEDSVDRGSIFPHRSMASSPRKSGLVRSSSSQSSLFGALSNGSHAHGLSNLSSSAGVGTGISAGGEGGGGEDERGGGAQPPKLRTSKSRTSFHSATSFSQPRRPYGAMGQRSFSQSNIAHLSRTSLHDTATATAGAGASTTSLHHPFSTSRSNSFVDNAVAEAGFTGIQREILEAELTNSSKKFYDRRDFDSKIIEVENSSSDLWQRRQPRKERSMTGLNSLHGLQALSAGGAIGGGQVGLDERVHDMERRAKSQAVQPRRKMSMGTRMRNSIFGRRGQSSDSEDDEEADTE
ncbi:MAG: EXS family-domain-containing protein [Linnemannia gamsii]|nr:MAG: EXS family-domain-containing protein [Linnemannia gamsii]